MELRRVTDPMPQSRIESYIRRKKPGFCRDLLTVLYNISLLLRILFLKIENLRLKRSITGCCRSQRHKEMKIFLQAQRMAAAIIPAMTLAEIGSMNREYIKLQTSAQKGVIA